MNLLFPKRKRRLRSKGSQAKFAKAVRLLDGGCMNPNCPCRKDHDNKIASIQKELSSHHIERRGQGGYDIVSNGITFCLISHNWADGVGCLTGIGGERITADEFVLSVLEYWAGKPEDRWQEQRERLRDKVACKNIGVGYFVD